MILSIVKRIIRMFRRISLSTLCSPIRIIEEYESLLPKEDLIWNKTIFEKNFGDGDFYADNEETIKIGC